MSEIVAPSLNDITSWSAMMVSCGLLYGLGFAQSPPIAWLACVLDWVSRDKLLMTVDNQFERNDIDFRREFRGSWRCGGAPSLGMGAFSGIFRSNWSDSWGWSLDRPRVLGEVDHLAIFPATHFVTIIGIAKIREAGLGKGASYLWEGRQASGSPAGTGAISKCCARWAIRRWSWELLATWMVGAEGRPPYTLLDTWWFSWFMIDESRGHGTGGRAMATALAKKCWIEYGFRLPSALDNAANCVGRSSETIFADCLCIGYARRL